MAIGTTAAILGATGIGSSILSGIFGSKAATGAAKDQSAAAEREAQEIIAAVARVNPKLAEEMERAIAGVRSSSEAAATGVETAGTAAAGRVDEATRQANALLDPYTAAGATATTSLLDLVQNPGAFNRQAFMDDEGYQFRLGEGQKALQARLSQLGIGPGGRALKEFTRFNQGLASEEYGNAFDRYMRDRELRRSGLTTLIGTGSGAAQQAGSNLIGAGRYAGDVGVDTSRIAGGFRIGGEEYAGNARLTTSQQMAQNELDAQRAAGDWRTGAAAARASGRVGRANAITGALTGGARAVGGALTLNQLIRNPAFRVPNDLAAYGATGGN